MQFKN